MTEDEIALHAAINVLREQHRELTNAIRRAAFTGLRPVARTRGATFGGCIASGYRGARRAAAMMYGYARLDRQPERSRTGCGIEEAWGGQRVPRSGARRQDGPGAASPFARQARRRRRADGDAP
jgi:hypothetical protein